MRDTRWTTSDGEATWTGSEPERVVLPWPDTLTAQPIPRATAVIEGETVTLPPSYDEEADDAPLMPTDAMVLRWRRSASSRVVAVLDLARHAERLLELLPERVGLTALVVGARDLSADLSTATRRERLARWILRERGDRHVWSAGRLAARRGSTRATLVPRVGNVLERTSEPWLWITPARLPAAWAADIATWAATRPQVTPLDATGLTDAQIRQAIRGAK